MKTILKFIYIVYILLGGITAIYGTILFVSNVDLGGFDIPQNDRIQVFTDKLCGEITNSNTSAQLSLCNSDLIFKVSYKTGLS